MKDEEIEVVELEQERLNQLLHRAQVALPAEDFAELGKLVKGYQFLLRLIETKNITVARLKQIVFGSTSEKTSDVFKDRATTPATEKQADGKKKLPGHGRNGSAAYSGAEKVKVPHPLQPKSVCPECGHGKLYAFTPTQLVRITGQAPLQATIYELPKLRCNGCGHTFQTPLPDGIEYTKHDATAAGMIALLKYGVGVPFNRIEKLEQGFGIPLPASTQWGVVEEAGAHVKPVHNEMIKQAAQGSVLHNDDTSMTILEVAKARNAEPENSGRKGCFTTGIVSVHEKHNIALFFTGTNHAGENLEEVLRQRAAALGPPIQMCDALSRNSPGELETILANCVAHARRRFVEVAPNFPDECKYLLDTLKDVYINDAKTKREKMSDQERQVFHEVNTKPLMDDIKKWAEALFQEKKVEPNSGLGQALTYMLKHWDKLTLFLRQPGAPLDNNICERALKKAILHRKNALFYKTANGAHVGDIFMSLIHTAELSHANPFEYLVALLQHRKNVAEHPEEWMPWKYQETLAAAGGGHTPAGSAPAP